MTRFRAMTSIEAGRTVVALAGECDLACRAELTTVLTEAVTTAPLVIIDLAQLRFLDSSGLHTFIAAHHAARQHGTRVCVINQTGPVAQVLHVTGVDELLAPLVDEAAPADESSAEGAGRHD